MDWLDVVIVLLKAVGAFVLWLLGTAGLIWGERRLVAKMQSRIGPNRLGPFGLLQTIADGAKLFFKEDITPTNVDRLVYLMAPAVSAIVAIVTFAVIPYGGTFTIGDRTISLQVWDPDIGILWVLAMGSIGVYGTFLGGWASGSKYPLLGSVRSSAQIISYELAMGLGVASVFVWTGSLQSSVIVANQSQTLLGFIPAWNLFLQLPAFLLFFIAAVAETQRPPFDLPEAEGELVAGFHTEYSGAKFAMFFLAEFMNVITMSALVVTLFLGGPNGPVFGPPFVQAILPTIYFVGKTFMFVFVFVWLRGTLPRLRYDRLMDIGWKVMLPIGLLWVMATATIVVVQQTVERATVVRTVLIAGAVVLAVLIISSFFGRRPAETGGGDDGGGGGVIGGPDDTGAGGRALAPPAKRAADERTPEQVGV